MTVQQGDVALIEDPIAQELLGSQQMAQFAYNWTDGSPRVVTLWFHWAGDRIVFGTPARAPKVRALQADPRVAVTVEDSGSWPYRELNMRGEASVEMLEDVSPEYAASASRYFGDAAEDWLGQVRGRPMARISVVPAWVGIMDFQTRFPSALSG